MKHEQKLTGGYFPLILSSTVFSRLAEGNPILLVTQTKTAAPSLTPILSSHSTSDLYVNPIGSKYIQNPDISHHLHCYYLDKYNSFLTDLSTSTVASLHFFSFLLPYILIFI